MFPFDQRDAYKVEYLVYDAEGVWLELAAHH
jgi:hypothetical protein